MVLHLVRHALAGSRPAWTGVDFERPLDALGEAQAQAICEDLKARPVKRIVSSPALRCVDTVKPLAQTLGLTVELSDELAEGASVAETFGLLSRLAVVDGDSVLCSHGDVIPTVIWTLARSGLVIGDRYRCKKSSIWELAVVDGRVASAVYRHPRDFGAHFKRPSSTRHRPR